MHITSKLVLHFIDLTTDVTVVSDYRNTENIILGLIFIPNIITYQIKDLLVLHCFHI